MAEIAGTLQSNTLSERPQQVTSSKNPQQATSSFQTQKVAKDNWKGLTREQLKEIQLIQKQQIQEKQVLGDLLPTPLSLLSSFSWPSGLGTSLWEVLTPE